MTIFDEMSKQTKQDAVGKARLVGKAEDGSVEWHTQRSEGLGGSDAAVVLGLEPFGKTRHQLWREKLGRAESFMGNYHTDYGDKLESYIFERANEKLTGAIECGYTLQHPELDFMQGNIDGLIPGEGIVEIKTSTSEAPDNGAKKHHYAQIQHYLGVTGLDYAQYVFFEAPFDKAYSLQIDSKFIAANLHDDYWEWVAQEGELTIRKIERDQPYIERLMDAEMEFWQCVEEDTEPGRYLPEGEIEVEDETLQKYLDDYGKAKARIEAEKSKLDLSEAKELKEQAKSAIKSHCECYDAKKVHLPNGDYVLWNGRGYWQAKPQERSVDKDEVDAPF